MRKRYDRARYGPGWFEVIFGALLSIILGVVLAVSYFVFRPVTRVKELPKDPVPGMVYYIEGSRDYSNARRLTAKQRFFAKGGSVVVNEDELNTAANPVAAPVTPGSEPAPAPTTVLTPGSPNFRIHDGLLQITVPMRIKVDSLFIDQVVLVQATGTFVRRGEVFVFAPKTVFVGSCPVDRIPKAVDFIMKKVFDSQPVPPDIAASWGKLADVTIEGSTLRLTMP
jgi:hypothetical protein